jgi:sulfur carrier protein
MTVNVNGTDRVLADGARVGDAVRLLTGARAGVAVAVNDEVISRGHWDVTPLADGDRVEVLTAVQGG